MLPIINYTLNELKTLFQKSWEWRIGYVLIGGFIAARWLGLFSSIELITLDLFLSHRLPEKKDNHVVIVLVDETDFQGDGALTDDDLVELLEKVLSAEPTVVGLNIFREQSGDETQRSRLINLFETHDNLIGVQKAFPPKEIPPLKGVSQGVAEEQFGINDIPIDQDSRIRRVFVGAYLPDETPDIPDDNPFQLSFSFKVAEKYLESQEYSLENFPADPITPSFRLRDTAEHIKIPRLKPTFGGYIRNNNISDIQTLLNFRFGTDTFTIFDAKDLVDGTIDLQELNQKAVIIGATDPVFPRFLPVSTSSNLIDEDTENREIIPRLGIIGAELEAHSTSQIINAVLHRRPLIDTIHSLFEDGLIFFSGVIGILIGNTFESVSRNFLLLITTSGLLLGSSYFLLLKLGIWLPIFPASSILAITGITYIAFYQSERLALMESSKLEEERRKAIEKTFNAIHAGPLQTLASLLRNVRDGNTDQKYLLDDLEFLNKEIRGIGERLRQEAIEDVYFIDVRRNIKLDLTHPMHEVLYEVYNLCLQKDLPGFKCLKIRSVSFEPFDCKSINLEIKQKLCWFLQESLENVGKHALGTTRLLVTGKIVEEFYTLCIEDNGLGVTSSHIGEGTKFFYRLEELLRGKFYRASKPTGGTVCKLTWSLYEK